MQTFAKYFVFIFVLGTITALLLLHSITFYHGSCPHPVPEMKISFERRSSGAIRCLVSVDGFSRIRKSIDPKYKLTTHHKWIDQRVSGRNSQIINRELDRIEEEIGDKLLSRYFHSQDQLEKAITRIIDNKKIVVNKKSLSDNFEAFLISKQTEVNPNTKKMISRVTIRDYRTAFGFIQDMELEDFSKSQYHVFSAQMLANYSANYTGKVITKLITFFKWCEKEGLPINPQYKEWKPFSEESKQEERALNSDQLDSIYRIEVDPVEVFQIARDKHKKILDGKQVKDLCESIREASRQAVAIASIGSHKEDFWKLTNKNVQGKKIIYYRGKNNIKCVAPFRDSNIFHAMEFANLSGGPLFKRMTKINYYLSYVKEICNIPFNITASNFRKTFASILYYELKAPLWRVQLALGHTKEETTRKYLGIQLNDIEQYDEELFNQ